ncbi:hypothetical protein KJ596_04125 [Patescibacteria group bacterium]|nr:hypothetical protein [Patescibacteria group bacterium]MBU1868139.1 hypothetical protein [Patescibacteria group bacterium]
MNPEFAKAIQYIKKRSGSDFKKLRDHLDTHNLFIFLLSKKIVGKNLYSTHLEEIFPNKFDNVSFGETIRYLKEEIKKNKKPLVDKWGQETVVDLQTCSVAKLLPLTSVRKVFEHLINNLPSNKSILFDGLPREKEQIPIVIEKGRILSKRGYKVIFLEIDLADEILDARLVSRRVCPQCQYSGSILTPTAEKIAYDQKTRAYVAFCPKCAIPLEYKKGDHQLDQLGKLVQAVYERRKKFKQVSTLLQTQLSAKQYAFLRTDVPCEEFKGEKIELNLIAKYSTNTDGEVIIKRVPQTAIHNERTVYSLAPAGAVVRIIKTLAEVIRR